MRILYVCHRLPFPPKRGGKIRPFNMIRHFHRQGAEVWVASLARSRAELAEGEGLREHCRELLAEVISPVTAGVQMLARLPTPEPSSMGFFHSARLRARVAAALEAQRFDLVFVHCSSVAPYVADVRGTPKMLDFGDMDSQKWLEYAGHRRFPLTLGYRLEGMKLERAERRLADAFDFCTCTTRAELETLRSLGSATPSDWFPNGVDAGFFAPAQAAFEADRICFVGRMDYYPNQQAVLEFCRDVWPELRTRRPQLRFAIVGADPPAFIRRLAAIPGVEVTGSVPDVRPHVAGAALTIAPLRIARGTQNKILESLAMGVPVVASPLAAAGVDAEPGEHLLTARSPAECRDAILRIVTDPQERRRFSEAGRERVLARHDWAASMRRLDGFVEAVLSRNHASHARRAAAAAG
jgi:hypothetical protein